MQFKACEHYGLNSSRVCCYLCQEVITVVSHGVISAEEYTERFHGEPTESKDGCCKAPEYMLMTDLLCNRCQQFTLEGVVFYEAYAKDEDEPKPISTGRCVCVEDAGVESILRRFLPTANDSTLTNLITICLTARTLPLPEDDFCRVFKRELDLVQQEMSKDLN